MRNLLAGSGPLTVGRLLSRSGSGDTTLPEVSSVAHDSRVVEAGALFACIPGETSDGHDHAADAVAAGAVALLVERELALPVPQVLVPSVRDVLGPVAAAVAGEPSSQMTVVGVTGTNGKTTTTLLLESVFTEAGFRAGVIGTLGSRIAGTEHPGARTTPEAPDLQRTLAMMRASGVENVAMEVSSHALEQHRVDGTVFAAACFTNLSHDHLDYHGTFEAYFEAKARLFTADMIRSAAVNRDDRFGRQLLERLERTPVPVATFGEDRDSTWSAGAVGGEGWNTSFELLHEGAAVGTVRMSLPGAWNRQNALGAAATAALVGIPSPAIVEGLSRSVVVPGRLERVSSTEPFDVVVDYAHTPDALTRVLETARSLSKGEVWVVFGCGGDRDRAKRPMMGMAAARGADHVIVTSDNPRSEDPVAIGDAVADGVREAGGHPVLELDRAAAIQRTVEGAANGDVVVIAGKGHEQGQEIDGRLHPFDDRDVARGALSGLR